jgi:hypothetical protein
MQVGEGESDALLAGTSPPPPSAHRLSNRLPASYLPPVLPTPPSPTRLRPLRRQRRTVRLPRAPGGPAVDFNCIGAPTTSRHKRPAAEGRHLLKDTLRVGASGSSSLPLRTPPLSRPGQRFRDFVLSNFHSAVVIPSCTSVPVWIRCLSPSGLANSCFVSGCLNYCLTCPLRPSWLLRFRPISSSPLLQA